MKPPIIIEQLFKKRGDRKVNWEGLKYTVFILAIVFTVTSFVFYVVDSSIGQDQFKDKVCAVQYGSPDWEHERHDTNPDDQGAPVIDRCINKKNNNEVKEYPKDAPKKAGVSVTVEKK